MDTNYNTLTVRNGTQDSHEPQKKNVEKNINTKADSEREREREREVKKSKSKLKRGEGARAPPQQGDGWPAQGFSFPPRGKRESLSGHPDSPPRL